MGHQLQEVEACLKTDKPRGHVPSKTSVEIAIFFDHDLGEDKNGTGYDAAKWLVDYCMENGEIDVPDWGIQSANPVGRDNINSLLKNYRKHLNL